MVQNTYTLFINYYYLLSFLQFLQFYNYNYKFIVNKKLKSQVIQATS